MSPRRVRIRFRKQGDLRLIGHRDLLRTFERLFRRAGLRLKMSDGFHPKPLMTFQSALGLGIAGADEVMEVVLQRSTGPAEAHCASQPSQTQTAQTQTAQTQTAQTQAPNHGQAGKAEAGGGEAGKAEAGGGEAGARAAEVLTQDGDLTDDALGDRLREQAPEGLEIVSVATLGPGVKKGRAESYTYQIPTPPARRQTIERAIELLLSDRRLTVPREGKRPIEVHESLISLELLPDGVLQFQLRSSDRASIRPRDLVALLDLADLEAEGFFITRTEVKLVD